MVCPRCGLEQPKDRYCAGCGLDVDKFNTKPKPVWVRMAQNPDFHLTLIVILIVIVIGYIFYVQRGLVSRKFDAMLRGTPLSSREAGDPNAPERSHSETAPAAPTTAAKVPETVAAEATIPDVKPETPAAAVVPEAKKVDVTYWEISREALANMISGAEKLGESSGGRAYFWAEGAKAVEAVEKNGRRVGSGRTMNLENGAQIQIETPPTAPESFQFGLYFQVARAAEAKEATLKWESTMVLPPQESAAEAASRQPVVKALTETTLSGQTPISGAGAVVIVFEPTNRMPRTDYIMRAGDGPWSIMASDAFRAGASEWVVLVQLK